MRDRGPRWELALSLRVILFSLNILDLNVVIWLVEVASCGDQDLAGGVPGNLYLSSLIYYLICKGKPFPSSSRALYQKGLPPPN